MIKVIHQGVYPIHVPAQSTALNIFERAARTCYQSFDRQQEGSAERLLSYCIGSGHHSTLEHINATVRFITSRGVTHELVRHRLCAFSQESTRYVKYDTVAEFIEPYWYQTATVHAQQLWISAMASAISYYTLQLKNGLSPQAARGVLPNDLKTEIVVTTNIREWRHILSLRLEKDAHPDMRLLMQPLAQYFMEQLPAFFADLDVIQKRYHEEL